jgi:uncharacterized membrane protein YozB (DUF420 family)
LRIPYGGFSELPPQLLYGSIVGFAVLRGVHLARRRRFAAHREWMLRAAATGLGIALTRVFYVWFLHGTNATSQEFYPTVLWLGSALNLIAVEIWINLTRTDAVVDQRKSRLTTTRTERAT